MAATSLIGKTKLEELEELYLRLGKDRTRIEKLLAIKRKQGRERVLSEEEFVKAIDEGNMLFKVAIRGVISKIVVYREGKFDLVSRTGKIIKLRQ